jgi:hypothetical protein
MMAAQLAEETEDECFALVTKTVMRKYDWSFSPDKTNQGGKHRECLLYVTIWSAAQTGLNTKMGWSSGRPECIMILSDLLCLPGILLDPEDRRGMHPCNVVELLLDYTPLRYSSYSWTSEPKRLHHASCRIPCGWNF